MNTYFVYGDYSQDNNLRNDMKILGIIEASSKIEAKKRLIEECYITNIDNFEDTIYLIEVKKDSEEILSLKELYINDNIKKISDEEACKIIDSRKPHGLFYVEYENAFLGIDNTTGDAWTEEFEKKDDCLNWLLRLDN